MAICAASSPDPVNDWVNARCGNGSAVWTYEGTLYDPLDGRKICQVEGLELVRTLATPKDTVHRRFGLVSKELSNSTTILSRKLFCYKSPDEPDRLLRSIKLRHNSPTRSIPTNQAVALYDSATTMSSAHDGKQLVLHTEFPNGKCYWATVDNTEKNAGESSAGTRSLDFTVFTRKRPTDLPTLSPDISSEGVVVAPKRSKLIQFGASSNFESSRFGVRETYSYSITKQPLPGRGWRFWVKSKVVQPVCSVKYTRYGEGPPWYGPGKYLMLEVRGRRAVDMSEASAMPATLASHIPFFSEVDKRIETDDEATQAVQAFKEAGLTQLPQERIEAGSLRERMIIVWNKVRTASNHRAGKSPC
jgi:hypothetical protein